MVLLKIPCLVEDHVFDDINFTQAHKFHAGINLSLTKYLGGIVLPNSDFIDKMVVYNYLERVWSVVH